MDAACDVKKGVIGLGGIVRNDRGEQKGAFTHNMKGCIPVPSSEAMAILFGMRFCLLEGHTKLIVESDAINVISGILCNDEDLSVEGAVIDEIRLLGRSFDEIRWKKIPRAANRAAHCLARDAVKGNGIKFWKEVGPPWLNDIVINDMYL